MRFQSFLRLSVEIKYLDRLDDLMYGSETAKLAFQLMATRTSVNPTQKNPTATITRQ